MNDITERPQIGTGGRATTYKEAQKLLAKWTKRLCLQDWKIKLNINCKPEDMAIQDASGDTSWSESGKCARIDIIDPAYYGKRIVPFRFEQVLVHELLHLKFTFWCQEDKKIEDRLMHQYIDDLARALTWEADG